MTQTNPLLTNYVFPPFNILKPEHFMPALDEAATKARTAFAAIIENPEAPDFQNTVVPLEKLFAETDAIEWVLANFMKSANSPAFRAVEKEVNQAVLKLESDVYQNPTLAARFEAVNAARPEGMSAFDELLMNKLARTFELSGALLDDARKARINAIDNALIAESSAFNENLQNASIQQAVLVTDAADLEGLDEGTVAALHDFAQKQGHATGWLVAAERLQVDGFLEKAGSRSLRERLYKAMKQVGRVAPYDNRPHVQNMLRLRHERAQLLGYPDYASYALKGTMAKSLESAEEAIEAMQGPVLQKLADEMTIITDYASKNGGPDTLEPWDAVYWAGRYCSDTYGYDGAEIAEYLELENVLKGFIGHAEKLFGLTFHANDTYPAYHEDVRYYDVSDSNTGDYIGVMAIDPYQRPGTKADGAWMMRIQKKDGDRPNIVSLNLNMLKPTDGRKTLMSIEEVRTVFHEGGHGLHGLLGSLSPYLSQHGTSLSSDFTEIHSSVQELWVYTPECLNTFARHHETCAPLPRDLYNRMMGARSFFTSEKAARMLQNSRRDLAAHQCDPATYVDDVTLENSVAFDTPYAEHFRPYPYARFGHLFFSAASKYAAGYYGYFWSEMKACAAFEPFARQGHAYDEAQGLKLRQFYELGSGVEPNTAFESYMGGKTGPEAYLEYLGIHSVAATKSAPALKPTAP